MTEKCVINVDKRELFPGETLSGTVELSFKTGKRVKDITVTLHGEGVLRIAHENRGDPIIEEYIHEEVEILKLKKYNSEEREIVLIKSGDHFFEYFIKLPNNLPSTFSLKRLNISYRVTVEVDVQGFMEPLEDSKSITICSYIDLNTVLMPIRRPLRATSVNDSCCICFKMQPLSLKIELPQGGYVPSEIVNVACFVRNKSMMNVSKVSFKIIQVFELVGRSKTYRKERLLQKIYVPDSQVPKGMQKLFRAQLQIPEQTKAPSLTSCHMLRMHCELVGKAVLPYPHFDLIASIPFYLGTVPLQFTPIPEQ
ncbi:hypothetical protein PPYR_03139 [Photinus pyralis]|uniref:Arrestin C-terminal-like domain-containing protein n=1 Tax=Photinus pyralis TaxID=7054 RepID=A0A1Y1L870_PHOPY|nr:uncharacterized protein LOC116162484 [Photinus pyralis]KAB0791339.1 hypothetical protein PPYR_03139 [Photinus pyralis]